MLFPFSSCVLGVLFCRPLALVSKLSDTRSDITKDSIRFSRSSNPSMSLVLVRESANTAAVSKVRVWEPFGRDALSCWHWCVDTVDFDTSATRTLRYLTVAFDLALPARVAGLARPNQRRPRKVVERHTVTTLFLLPWWDSSVPSICRRLRNVGDLFATCGQSWIEQSHQVVA